MSPFSVPINPDDFAVTSLSFFTFRSFSCNKPMSSSLSSSGSSRKPFNSSSSNLQILDFCILEELRQCRKKLCRSQRKVNWWSMDIRRLIQKYFMKKDLQMVRKNNRLEKGNIIFWRMILPQRRTAEVMDRSCGSRSKALWLRWSAEEICRRESMVFGGIMLKKQEDPEAVNDHLS